MDRITVLLAEDHLIVREGLRALLNLEKDIQVIAEAGSGRQAVELAASLRPDVVVMDIAMPLLNGLEAARQILQSPPSAKVVMLSAHSDPAYIEQVVELGVSGYLVKQTAAEILPVAIRQVHRGGTFFSPSIAGSMTSLKGANSGTGGAARKHRQGRLLTSRETEVLQLIAEGMSTKQMAGELGVSVKTTEKHRQTLMNKLHIHDVASLTRYAISSGVIESPHLGGSPQPPERT